MRAGGGVAEKAATGKDGGFFVAHFDCLIKILRGSESELRIVR